ncbi:MAG: helix-turn-helix domain-containing protein [Cyclobacteriaceae bacterium]|nr:helix-turn-helix domain-containing protein [Cyclobacteriaceae bacterium]
MTYVTKPFDQEMLLARMKNLLRERKILREKFSLAWANSPAGHAVVTADEKFMGRLNSILERSYHDPEFSTSALGREAGYSHSVLYRKLKALTNMSPNAYIRNFRLIKAQRLLASSNLDVSSAAYSCGFSNLSYFSKCFKEFFHQAPHESHNSQNH